ncbi:conserved Plasmodium protein, unknown function [Plasmodium ovale]|uniref:Uncharacterized protein n=1 Tax=Plasmodium ovale TaxID=36330 RepID=A0A1D3U7R8_PLAOA|nr:conserved Plasmodium protein, unknown function [Plasmodium ovale]
MYSVCTMEDLFFKGNFSPFHFFKDNHVKINDLKINTEYLFQPCEKINVELALSALNGINAENQMDSSGVKNDNFQNRGDDEKGVHMEMKEWKQMSKEDFFKKNIRDEDLIKGLPDPYRISNISDSVKSIQFYFSNMDDKNTREIIYRGTYIPEIYNNVFFILSISFMYIFCMKMLFQGYIKGKNVAKEYIPRISTLFIFFVLLKILLPFFPAILCSFVCLIWTLYFYSISMSPCEQINFVFHNSKIKKEPIGWVLIVYAQSLLIGNILYHFLCTPNVLVLLMRCVQNDMFVRILCLLFLLFIASIIFFLMISNIFSAKKAQNFVFSFTSTYLIVSSVSYFYNLFVLRFLNDSRIIIQIEPIMFFSYVPKFVFNKQNVLALFFLCILTTLSILLPKLEKMKRNLFGQKKKKKKKKKQM